jgi:hypothetical protein
MQPMIPTKHHKKEKECFITNDALFLPLEQCIAEISTPFPPPWAITYFMNTMLMMKP